MEAFETPILFLVFNRPDKTKVVFEAIRNIKPTKLFVAADGPRHNIADELEKCEKVRAIATSIDWECELNTLFRDENLGCGKAVCESITWFFENVEEGIILEDDCLPDASFFSFCSILLNRYRMEKRIMHIGGTNLQFGTIRGNGDYYYSIICHVWGWATWRRAWNNYEFLLNNSKNISDDTFNEVFNFNQTFIKYYKDIFNKMCNSEIDTWDYQWFYSIILHKGLSICPNVNLVKNLGFGEDATHTLYENEWNTMNVARSINSFNQPSTIEIDFNADAFTIQEVMGIKETAQETKTFNIKSFIFDTYSLLKYEIYKRIRIYVDKNR
jgi:hypothetical protein